MNSQYRLWWSVLLFIMLTTSLVHADYWFLGVGNDGYIMDIDGLYDTFMTTYNWQNTTVHSRRYTDHGGSQILTDLAWLGNAGPGDLAVFFYSGHGSYTGDDSGEELSGWSIDSEDETIGFSGNYCTDDAISNALSIVNPQAAVVTIFDACFSGGMVGGLDDLNALPNVYALLSSREDEYSEYIEGDPYSIFTTQLINGISGSRPADLDYDDSVTLDEWFGYAAANTIGQTPVNFDADNLGTIPIAVPEPTTVALLGLGSLVLTFRRKRGSQ